MSITYPTERYGNQSGSLSGSYASSRWNEKAYQAHNLSLAKKQSSIRKKRLALGCTALMHACQQGNTGVILEHMRAKRTEIHCCDKRNKNALHYCAVQVRPESKDIVAAASLAITAPELLDSADEDGFTPLHLSVIQGNLAMVNLLLANNADVNATDNEGHSVVHWATVCGEVEILRTIIAAGANITIADINGGSPLHYAAQMCGTPYDIKITLTESSKLALDILEILLSHPQCNVNVQDKDGRQPLLWAASAGSPKAVVAIVKAGGRVESADKDGLTALHCAASRGHTECINTLISLCGAPTDLIDSNGCTALHYAVTLGHADATARLLELSADPNRQDRKGRSPAHCGCAKGQLETVKILKEHGANLWLRNAKGDLPMHEATVSGRRELIEWLLLQRIQQVNTTSNDGRSILHIAATHNYIDICKILLDYGADINAIYKNSKGLLMTPLDSALQKGYRSTAKFLQSHGGLPANKLYMNKRYPNPFKDSKMSPVRPISSVEAKDINLSHSKKIIVFLKEISQDHHKYKHNRNNMHSTYKAKEDIDNKCKTNTASFLRRRSNSCDDPKGIGSILSSLCRSKSNIEIRYTVVNGSDTFSSESEDSDSCGNCCYHKYMKHQLVCQGKKKRKEKMHCPKCKEKLENGLNENNINSGDEKPANESVETYESPLKIELQCNDEKTKESICEVKYVSGEEIVTDDTNNLATEKEKLPEETTTIENNNELIEISEMKLDSPLLIENDKSLTELIRKEENDLEVIANLEDHTDNPTSEVEVEDVNANVSEKEGQKLIDEDITNANNNENTPNTIETTTAPKNTETVIQNNEETNPEDAFEDNVGDTQQPESEEQQLDKDKEQLDISNNISENNDKVNNNMEQNIPKRKIHSDKSNEETETELNNLESNFHSKIDSNNNYSDRNEAYTVLPSDSSDNENCKDEENLGRKSSFQILADDNDFNETEDVFIRNDQPESNSPPVFTVLADKKIENFSNCNENKRSKLYDNIHANGNSNVNENNVDNINSNFDTNLTSVNNICISMDLAQQKNKYDDCRGGHGKRIKGRKNLDSTTNYIKEEIDSNRDYRDSIGKDRDSINSVLSHATKCSKIPVPREGHHSKMNGERYVSKRQTDQMPGDKKSCNMTTVAKSMQGNIRRYYMERKIFQHLLELKSLQIRSKKYNESVLVKKAVNEYHKSCATIRNEIGIRLQHYKSNEYTFKKFELFLYEILKKLQKPGANNFRNIEEVYTEAERRLSPDFGTYPSALQCTSKTHRCFHATHAYTGIPCAAYIPMMNHHTIPKLGFGPYKNTNTREICLPKILTHNMEYDGKVGLELSHGKNKHFISLPSDKLDANKRYYVTFSVNR